MAHEILSRQYIFQPRHVVESGSSDKMAALIAEFSPVKAKDSKSTEVIPLLPVLHNFQHDVESLWWIALYTMTGRVSQPEAKEYAKAVFRTTLTLSDSRRQAVLSSETTFQNTLESVLPPFVSSLARWLVLMRRDLLNHYEQHARNNDLFVKGSYGLFHTSFQNFFSPALFAEIRSGWQVVALVNQNPYVKSYAANKSRNTVNKLYPGRKRPQTKSDDKYKPSSRKKSKTSGQRMQTHASAASASASGNS